MDSEKEKQDELWSSLSDEMKRFIRDEYLLTFKDYPLYPSRIYRYQNMFGKHNLEEEPWSERAKQFQSLSQDEKDKWCLNSQCEGGCNLCEPITGIQLIYEERDRQKKYEGFDSDHDSKWTSGELAKASACYALGDNIPNIWPFDKEWWKPKDRIRDLQKAGALIAAEIDRLLKLEKNN